MASNEYYQQGYPPQQGGYPPQGYPPQGYPQQPQAVNKPSRPQTLIDTPCADSIDSKYTPEPINSAIGCRILQSNQSSSQKAIR